ncbi:hypothetical protein RM549_16105 [Salegentibacter sp. F188]|uniref:Uncharacterized protein n=1 Tax=Autumnicola patrickiae TaxID=3075591 RepID=A0ABU3E6P4_9FLAO|nr:hypothetical protein [Salegentibacter sp. F188]MDT0691319.1 hypothetical protein [Salegentibacter sp. F188]
MATVDEIRNGLINKILSIQNKEILVTLDEIITSGNSEADVVSLTEEQKEILQMAEDDIQNGRLISQEEMSKRNLEWLGEK